MKFSGTLLTAATALVLSTGLSSAAVFDFDFSPTRMGRGSVTASGTFTTDDTPVDANVIAVTGTVNGVKIQGVDPAGINVYDIATNDVNFSFTDVNGIMFTLVSGFNGGSDEAISGNGRLSTGSLTVSPDTVGAVPLPASAPMFGAALLALGAVGYGLKRKQAAAA